MAQETIRVAGGTAKYVLTETEDKYGSWNDNWNIADGYWLIHEGIDHHVYKKAQ